MPILIQTQKMKKILFDMSFVKGNSYSGVGKYAFRILNYIAEQNQEHNYTLVLNIMGADRIRKLYPRFDYVVIGSEKLSKIPLVRSLFLARDFKKTVDRSDSDLVFCPWGNIITCLKTRKKKISVIHDVQLRIDTRGIRRLMYKTIDDLVVANSDKIITISDFSKRQIRSFYPSLTDADVISLSNMVDVSAEAADSPIVDGNYILYVGRICAQKNVITLVRAFAKAVPALKGYKLVLVGHKNRYFEDAIAPEIDKLNISENVEVVESCSEAELSTLYKYAKIFAFPSLREGFGAPPLEAALQCVPVISTKCDSLAEVTMDMLYYYSDPMDAGELANKMVEVASSPPSKPKLEEIKEKVLENYSVSVVGKRITDYITDYNAKLTK